MVDIGLSDALPRSLGRRGGHVPGDHERSWRLAGDAGNQKLRQQFDFLITTHSADAKPDLYNFSRGIEEATTIYEVNAGERQLVPPGMGVPSPDPTRSVVPLDLFPADIIESLSVQKSFSPDMPAHFGGGNVNIRTKSVPNGLVFKLSGSVGSNTNNSEQKVMESIKIA